MFIDTEQAQQRADLTQRTGHTASSTLEGYYLQKVYLRISELEQCCDKMHDAINEHFALKDCPW